MTIDTDVLERSLKATAEFYVRDRLDRLTQQIEDGKAILRALDGGAS